MGSIWQSFARIRIGRTRPHAITTLTSARPHSAQFLPCLLCGKKLERRTDKNGKPYFVCNPCGIQMFIRRQQGIERLENLLRNSAKNEIPFKQQAEEVYRIQALLTEIDGVKKQIDRLKSQIGFFRPDLDKLRACNLLKAKLENLFSQLKQIAQQRT